MFNSSNSAVGFGGGFMRVSCTVKAVNHEKDFDSLELAEMWIQTSPEAYRVIRVALDPETYHATLFVQ